MMHQRKSKKILIYIFLLFMFGSINNISINELNFPKIKNINIYGLENRESDNLLKNIESLSLDNIFFLRSNEIKNLIEKNSFVENYKISKKYPETLDIKIKKTRFLAKINNDGKIFIIGSNGKLIKNDHIRELPFIFGKPDIKEFLKIKKNIDQSNFTYDQIKNLFFFPSKRWDIELKNNIIIKLPNENITDSIESVYQFIKVNNSQNITVIDARIKNQIIINE